MHLYSVLTFCWLMVFFPAGKTMTGGYKEIEEGSKIWKEMEDKLENDKIVDDAIISALQEYTKDKDICLDDLELNLESLETQVVAGMNYLLTIDIDKDKDDVIDWIATMKIYSQPWTNTEKVTEITIDDAPSEETTIDE